MVLGSELTSLLLVYVLLSIVVIACFIKIVWRDYSLVDRLDPFP